MRDDQVEFERRALLLLEEALERPEESRLEWIREKSGADPVLGARVEQLLSSREGDTDAFGTRWSPDDIDEEPIEPPERVGAYRIVDLLGQGGMGAVFRAERDAGDFDHQVAIKLIRPNALSPALIERFERERQILASLSHPHIARLYDGGTTDEGGPFIVMEYIEGMPIAEWAEAEHLSLADRLRLMVEVCRAVGFAHQNLIIHRDLTPRNVLVTPEGTPKLIDFGIAKPQEDAATAKRPEGAAAQLSLTPGYAAPERYSGAPATTLTDIYSLGKLTQKLAGEDKTVPDLAAIIDRAAAADPDDRYPSANALARDIERFLDGYPVEARQGGRRYVLGKFVSRNRGPVVATAIAALLLIAALIGMAIGFGRARVAQAQAETRFEEVRQLANTLLFDVYDAVNQVPGSTAAREMLASTAQHYLDTLARDPDAPFDVRLEAGRGYMRLADVMGGVGGGNLGLRDEAMANYERADALLTALHDERPHDRNVALALADLRYARSNTMVHIAEDMDRGLQFARSIAPILDAGCPSGDDCTLRRAQADVAEGQNLYWKEDFDGALAAFDRGITALEGMASDARDAETALRLRALAYRLKGDTFYYKDDIPRAIPAYDTSVDLLRGAISRGIDDPDIQRDLAIVEWTRGGSLDEIDRSDDAIASLDDAYRIMHRLVETDPDDAGSLRLLAVIGGQRGLTLSSAGRFREAIEAAKESLDIRSRLSRMQPDQSGFFRDVAIQLNGLGDIEERAGNHAEACRYYRATIAQFDRLDDHWGMSDFDRNDTYARAHEMLGGC